MTLIPRSDLFGNPERASAAINSSGSKIAFLAPKNDILNVFVVDRASELDSAKAITNDTVRGIRMFQWTAHPDILVFSQDKGGDEDFKIYSVNVVTGKEICLTPTDKTTNQPCAVSDEYPDHFLIASNKRDSSSMDILMINIVTGEEFVLIENDSNFAGFRFDHKFTTAIGTKMNPDSSLDQFLFRFNLSKKLETTTSVTSTNSTKEGKKTTTTKTTVSTRLIITPERTIKASEGTLFIHLNEEDTGYGDTHVRGFSADLKNAYFASYEGRNTSALVSINLETKETTFIAQDPRANISNVLFDPVTRKVLAYEYNYDRSRSVVLDTEDKGLIADFEILNIEAGDDGEWTIDGQSSDGKVWVVTICQSDTPYACYVLDRNTKTLQRLFGTRPVLEKYRLHKMKAVEIKTRDNLNMLAYLTIPNHLEGKGPIPLIAFVHGGPYARDEFGFNRYHQLFADRGYAVISPQFRGSTGFGKEFLNVATGEWGGKMHDDVIDACDWCVEKGIAIKEKIAIAGGSYGGYAALVGVTFTPEYFACAVDIVGPSNIVTLLNSIPAYWGPIRTMLTSRIGADTDTEEGIAFMLSRSPITKVDKICRPLLIGQGANDPRVKQAESDQIFEAMTAKGIPVTYVLYPDEGHGFARPPNNISFTAVMEIFLAKHLGGSFEEVGNDFDGATLEFKGGREELGI